MVAGLEEDIITGELHTAAAGVSGDLSKPLGELQCDERPCNVYACYFIRNKAR